MTTQDEARLYGGPYVVTPLSDLKHAPSAGQSWAEAHHFDALIERFKALNAIDPESERACLPSTQMHALREAMAQGQGVGDARLKALRWLDGQGLAHLVEENDSLFVQRPDATSGSVTATRFVDALNGAGFWPRDDGQVQEGSGSDESVESPQESGGE